MRFQIPPQTHMERLKLSAMYLSLQRGLKRAGWGSVGWGAFTLALGVFFRSHTVFEYVWLIMGCFLVLEGLWILRSVAADPRVLLVEALALAVLGLLNTVGLYLEIKSGIRPVGGLQIIWAGVVQLISAYATFRSYPAYKRVYEHLDRACLYELETKIGDMWKRKAETDPELGTFKSEDKKCKVKFLPDMAILLLQNGKQVLLAERADVTILTTGNKLLSKMLKVELQIDEVKLKTEMDKASHDKWQAWLAPTQKPAEASS